MKVKELKQILDRLDPDSEVVIPADHAGCAIGPSSSVDVTSCHGGFDWDSGRVFISSKEKLAINDDNMQAAIKYFRKSIDFYQMAEIGVFNRNQVARELKRYLEDVIKELKETKN
jgi:hypothetical protein